MTVLLAGCSGFSLENIFNGGKDKSVIVDAEVKTDGGSTIILLTEGSAITFTEDYMVVKTADEEIKVPLNELNTISYK